MNKNFITYLTTHKFENIDDLKEFMKANCIYSQREGCYCVDKELIEGLQKNKTVYFEYICCESTSRAGYYYDVPSWYFGIYNCDEELYVCYESNTYNESDDFKGFYQLCKGIDIEE